MSLHSGQKKNTIEQPDRFDSDAQEETHDVVATHFFDGSFDTDRLGPGSKAAQASMESDSASGTPLRLTSNDTKQGGLTSTQNAHRHQDGS